MDGVTILVLDTVNHHGGWQGSATGSGFWELTAPFLDH